MSNIFKSGELDEKSNVQKMHIAKSDKPVKFYNLDAIISVGYRVNSKRATQFRVWATRTLKEYLVQGYAINEKRLRETAQKFKELQRAVNFLKEKSLHPEMIGQAEELLSIIQMYSNSFTLLYQYDKKTIKTYKTKSPSFELNSKECKTLIDEFRQKLAEKKEAGSLFGQEIGDKFQSIIGAIYQTFGGEVELPRFRRHLNLGQRLLPPPSQAFSHTLPGFADLATNAS